MSLLRRSGRMLALLLLGSLSTLSAFLWWVLGLVAALCDLTLLVKLRYSSPVGLQSLPRALAELHSGHQARFPSASCSLHLTSKPNHKVEFATKAFVGPCYPPFLPFLPCHGADLPRPAPSSLSNAAENWHNPMWAQFWGSFLVVDATKGDSEVEVSYPPISSLLCVLSHSVTSHFLWPHEL